MTINFQHSLDIALDALDKKTWATPLAKLERNFRGIPAGEISFADELLNVLWALNEARKEDADLPLNHLFAIRFAKMNAWTFRFSQSTPISKEYFNPLTAANDDLEQAVVSESGSAFPAEDIIKRWVRDHLV